MHEFVEKIDKFAYDLVSLTLAFVLIVVCLGMIGLTSLKMSGLLRDEWKKSREKRVEETLVE